MQGCAVPVSAMVPVYARCSAKSEIRGASLQHLLRPEPALECHKA